MRRPYSVNFAFFLMWATALGATAFAETTVYEFVPGQSTVIYQNWSWGYVKRTRSVAGKFRLTVDSATGLAWFDQVDAELNEEIWCLECYDNEPDLRTKSLDVLFHMSELKSIDVNDTAIKFVYERNIPAFPHADVHLTLTFTENSVHLAGRFSEACYDCGQFDLDAVAVRKTRVLYVDTAPTIIDHNCVDLSAIPDDYIVGAASLRVLMRHASVGQGIDWGLNCLAGNHPTKQACSDFVAGTYDRINWVLELRGGNWRAKVDDLVSQVALRANDFDVFMTKLCYIDALGNRHPDWEYFRSRMEQLEADYPDKRFVWWTIPLTRDGQPGTDVFNALMRSYCATNNKILFDIADIECHDPDGTKLTNAQGDEVISQNYTKEIHAGHLNIPGRIRVASAFWHLMARLAGWQRVYDTIQAAIDDANDGDVIIVKPGTYTGPGNRDIDFLGKAITVRSTDPNDPNIVATTIIDCNGTKYDRHRGFYFRRGESPNSILAGITITNGYGRSDDMAGLFSYGGGISCEDSSPTITRCWIVGNTAEIGAGLYCNRSSSVITDCVIGNNVHFDPEGEPEEGYDWACGGGIACDGADAIITRCTIENNSVYVAGGSACGGGIWSVNSCPVISDCIIRGNHAGLGGGGIDCWNPRATVTDCIIAENSSLFGVGGVECTGAMISNCLISNNDGGGISCGIGSEVTGCTIEGNTRQGGILAKHDAKISYCTIANNSADDNSGGIYSTGNPAITNCIVWSNASPNEPQISGEATVSYSDIEGGWLGEGNIDADPCFANPNSGDYHLRSQAGRWDPNSQTWVQDDVTSPCIDAGNPMSPIGLEPFPNGGIVNMGAYGGTAEASKSYFGEPVCETIVAGDINGDCKVDFADFQLMALHWLQDNRQEAELPQ